MSAKPPYNPQFRICYAEYDSGEPEHIFITRAHMVTDDFSFCNGMLIIAQPFDAFCAPVYVRSAKSIEEHIKYIHDDQIRKAIIIADDISFLHSCPSLESLTVIPSYTARNFDVSPLYDMPNLKELHFDTIYGLGDSRYASIDYSHFTRLQSLSVAGAKGHRNLSSVKGLHKLYLGKGQPSSKTISDMDLSQLEELEICQSSLRSLAGLESAKHLRKLCMSHCPSLSDISALTSAGEDLTCLEIEACGRISDFSALNHMPNMESLTLYGSNSIPDLSFLQNMKKLKSFRFTMKVEDGDLSLCKSISYVYCQNRRHYNMRDEELPKGNN